MRMELPKPIQDYFAAANAGDIERMLEPFAREAIVEDEGVSRAGRTAIREWMEDTTRKYAPTAQPERIEHLPGHAAVTALVSGTFPGSPVHLTYRFSIERDEIVRLEIV